MEHFALAACLFWIALALDRARAWPADLLLPAGRGRARAEPEVVAVIPARNEEAMLERTLPALLSGEGLAGIVVVDDASEDRTAAVARSIAAAAGRQDFVRIVRPGPTPPGWAGKVWALSRGVEVVDRAPAFERAPWLLLTDADIHHRQGSVEALRAQADAGFDLVSVMARLRTESFWERLLVPTFVYFFQLLYPFRKVADADSKVAAAAGGCVLVKRETLSAAGGLTSIAGAVIDDVALAGSVAGAGGRLWLGLDPGIRSLRPYPRLTDLWNMVSRSAYDQLKYRIGLLALVLLGLGLFFVGPALLAAAGGAAMAGGDPAAWRTTLLAGAALVLQVIGLRPAARHHGLGLPWATVLPVSALLFGAMTLWSVWIHYSGRGATWRGRRLGRISPPE